MNFKLTLQAKEILYRVFKQRDAESHPGEEPFKVIVAGEERIIFILNLPLAKSILKSRAFVSENYFADGLNRFHSANRDLSLSKALWENTPTFLEGAEHIQKKRQFKYELDRLSAVLDDQRPKIDRWFRKRSLHIESPLIFAQLFCRLCFGLLLNDLTNAPLRQLYRALSERQVLFCYGFRLSRHLRTEATLRLLRKNLPRSDDEEIQYLLAASLVTMGIDPIIGAICAGVQSRSNENLKEHVLKSCPTSYVSRICTQPATLEGFEFKPGDVCYAALVPSAKEAKAGQFATAGRSLAFGYGVHTCIGKQLTFQLLDIAQWLISRHFPQGFSIQPECHPEGGFLAYRSTE